MLVPDNGVSRSVATFRMSDALWTRAAPLIKAIDDRPPEEARAILDAVVYRALTMVAWSALPDAYPNSADVEQAFLTWRAQEILGPLSEVLLVQIDEE